MLVRGHAWIRLAQMRGKAAQLYRGGHPDSAAKVLRQMIAHDLALDLRADATLRARQQVAIAETQGGADATNLALYALALLNAGDASAAHDAAQLAQDAANESGSRSDGSIAAFVAGKVALALSDDDTARARFQQCRQAALTDNRFALAALALADLAAIDSRHDLPLSAAVCWQFCAACHQQIGNLSSQARALTAQMQCLLLAGNFDAALAVAADAHAVAEQAQATDISAIIDVELANYVESAGDIDHARAAAIVAVQSAERSSTAPAGRELLVLARLLLAQLCPHADDALRHLGAAIDAAKSLSVTTRTELWTYGMVQLQHAAVPLPIHAELVESLQKALQSWGDPALVEQFFAVQPGSDAL
jgi:tetratricopeptide (TPR) repeat protein